MDISITSHGGRFPPPFELPAISSGVSTPPGFRDPARPQTAGMSGTGEQGESWADRRGDAAAEHAARLGRQRAAEAAQASALLADFVREAGSANCPRSP